MKKKILFSATSAEKRAAVVEEGKLIDFVVERPDDKRIVGNIYRGRVVSILPGIQSAFIDIGIESNVFLHASDVDPSLLLDEDDDMIARYRDRHKSGRYRIPRVPIEKILSKGQEIIVQVIKEPINTKNAKVTTQISIAGRFLVLVPDSDFIGVSKRSSDSQKRRNLKRIVSQIKPPGIGFIVRTIGVEVSEDVFEKEIHQLIKSWKDCQKRALSGKGPKLLYKELGITTGVIRDLFTEEVDELLVDNKQDYEEILSYLKSVSQNMSKRVTLYKGNTPLFDKYNTEKQLERSLKRKVWLKNGGYLVFDHAEALLAIDINTGRNTSGKDLEKTVFHTNLEAIGEICRQLRLRDIGGLIVIDFIDMRDMSNRRRIESELKKQLEKDSTSASCTGLSKFCLVEITRKRVRPELQEIFTDVCPACNGLGWVFSPETVTTRIERDIQRRKAEYVDKNLLLEVHPSVATYIGSGGKKVISKIKKEYKITLVIKVNEDLDQDEYEISIKS